MNNAIEKIDKQKDKGIELLQKSGITLISLVLMVVILIILTSTIVVSVASVSNNSKMVAFATDLNNIEQSVQAYYLENNELPKISAPVEYSKSSLISLAELKEAQLESEIVANFDTSDKFFEIDLNKIDIANTTRGLKQKGSNDIYVVNSRNFRVYYVKGVLIGGDIYFSLTDKLTKSTNIQGITYAIDNILVESEVAGIKIVKNKKGFTNNLEMSVSSILEEGQGLRYIVAGTNPIDITGNFIKVEINKTTMTAITNAVANFTNVQTPNKTFAVQKYIVSTGDVIATATMSIDNLDIQVPMEGITGEVATNDIDAFTDFNTITLPDIFTLPNNFDLGGSGIKEIRYEYSTKLNVNGWVESYFKPFVNVDPKYLINMGKRVTGNILKLDKHIQSVKVIYIDNAGNVSALRTYIIPPENLVKETISIKNLIPEVTTYINRVGEGGGEVIYTSAFNDNISFLKDKNIYNNLVLYITTFGGIKKNIVSGTTYVQTAYDFKGIDGVQSTATMQPEVTKTGMKFDGVDDYLDLGRSRINPYINGKAAITLSTWVNANRFRVNDYIIYEPINSSLLGVRFKTNDNSTIAFGGRSINTDTFQNVDTTSVFQIDKWYMITGIMDFENDKIYVYVNGALDNSINASFNSGTYTSGTPDINSFLGNHPTADRQYKGIIDEVMIFNKALDANEILALYNFTKGNYIE